MDSFSRGGSRSLNSLRILMQMRSNAVTQRGGDTVVMERLTEGLRARGHQVDVDLEEKRSPSDYDLVHLYNFATPDITERQARAVVAAKKPYVVTTMYEDWPIFFNKMVELYFGFERYLNEGQPRDRWQEILATSQKFAPSDIQDNQFTSDHADALITSGEFERRSVVRDYPRTKRVEIYHCGCNVVPRFDEGELFRKTHGLDDYVLCVGRLEWRKNQLMVLKALEDSDLPLVFLTGGFTYQPDYEALCRKFKRRGRTLFLGKVPADMLASAYAGARVHVLPSWFELPGLVSIEAAHYGANLVVTDYGTIRDYVGEDAFYCQPDQAESVYNATVAAFYSPRKPSLQERVKRFTWDNAVNETSAVYEQVLRDYGYVREAIPVYKTPEPVAPVQVQSPVLKELDRLFEEGEALLAQGSIDAAAAKYQQAIAVNPASGRAYRSLGAAYLAGKRWADAEAQFRKAITLSSNDLNAQIGLATSRWNLGDREAAFAGYSEVLRRDPYQLTAITYFTGLCYELNRLRELEGVLRTYLMRNPGDLNIKYCLAGCRFRQLDTAEARRLVDEILQVDPANANALELKERLQRESAGPVSFAPAAGPAVPAPAALNAELSMQIGLLERMHHEKNYTEVAAQIDVLLKSPTLSAEERALLSIMKGEAFACRGDFAEAESLFRAGESSPQYRYRALCGLAVLAAARERWTEAEQLFAQASSLNKDSDVALAGLGMCAAQARRNDIAWSYYQQAVRANPENLRALYGLIQLAYPMQRLSDLEQALVRYLEFCPASISMLYSYAGCAFAQGKMELAREQIEKIRVFEPTNELAQELLERIEKQERSAPVGRTNIQ